MDDYNNGNNNTGWLFYILVIIMIFLWHENGDLKDKIKSYQNQSSSYEECISLYKAQEQRLQNVIADASTNLSIGGAFGYRSAQDSLDVHAANVDCYIPTISP